MPAAVTTLDYPAADRLMIHCVQVAGRQLVWLVLDGQFLHELRCPALSIPFLRAYGVCTSEQWPMHWPEPRAVLEEMDKAAPHKLHIQPIDLLDLGQRLTDETRNRRTHFSEMPSSQQRLPRFLTMLAAWMTVSDRSNGRRGKWRRMRRRQTFYAARGVASHNTVISITQLHSKQLIRKC